MIDNLQISSPSTGTLRIQGDADADRIEYLIQDAPGSTPSSDAEPTGQAEVSRGEAFSVDVDGLEPGGKRVFVRGVDTRLIGDRYISPDGDNAADGLTRETAWRTLDKLASWANALSIGDHVGVVLSGNYDHSHGSLTIGNNAGSTATVTIEFEPGVSVDTSASSTRIGGIDVQGGGTSWVVNLRGAVFTGNSIDSANGIGTANSILLTVNGADSEGNRAIFQGYDDGISFHGDSSPEGGLIINDCVFRDCSKAAIAHINDTNGTHNRCRFEAKSGATLGIGSDGSTVKSTFNDCEFVPVTDNQQVRIWKANRCKFGTLDLRVNLGNYSEPHFTFEFADCFLNAHSDGPGSVQFLRCYGFYGFRVRGTTEPAASFEKCVFVGRTNTANLAEGSFDGGGGNWLGGSPVFRDCVVFGYGTAFRFNSTTQRDHMNANWTVDHCAMFGNSVDFQSGLTIGTDLVTADPLLGSRATTNQSDWAVGSGSLCIGAGSDGGNIGFSLADLE